MKFNSIIKQKYRILNKLLITSFGMAMAASLACNEEYKPERETRDYGSFGTELYNIVYDNSANSAAHSSPEFLKTFESYRSEFIHAVDTTALEKDLEALNQVFVDIVPLYENMLYPGTLRKVAVVIDEIRQDPDAVGGVLWVAESPRLLAKPELANPIQHVFNYEDVAGITDELLKLVLRNAKDGERNATNQLLKEISLFTKDLKPDADPNRFIRRAIDMLFEESPDYAPQTAYEPQTAVRMDERGWPLIAQRSGSRVFEPFIDADGDGRPDGTEAGFFTLSNGSLVAPYEHFGDLPADMAFGEDGLLTYQGTPVFETFDIQKTPFAYLMREGDALLADSALDQALRAAESLLGTPLIYRDETGLYTGFPKDSGVLQLAAAVMTTLDHDSVGPNFEAAIQVLTHHKNVVAQLIYDVETIVDIIDDTPSNFSVNNDLIDRLLPELRKIAETPGLLSDLLMALDDPMAAEIAPILSELCQRKKAFIKVDPNGKYEQCFQTCDGKYKVGTFDRLHCIQACPRDEILGTQKVDHNQPESLDNRSLFQRTTHLMWETSETPYRVVAQKLTFGDADLTKIAQGFGTLIEFDNLAEAYLQTISGALKLEDHLSDTFISLAGLIGDDGSGVAGLLSMLVKNMFDLKLSVNPTTAEVTRLFNKPLISSQGENYRFDLNLATCRSGFKCLQVNADDLYALEATGLIDALYPVVKVFNDHKATAILARVISILFEYYTTDDVQYLDSTGTPLPLQPSDFRSMEPVLIRALDETNIITDVGEFGDALLEVKLADGTKLTDRFEKFVDYILTPDNSLRNIKGQASTADKAGNIIAPLSPAYLYIDAFRSISDFLDEHPKTETQLTQAMERIKDITIRTVKNKDGSIVFEKPAGIQLIASVLELLHKIYLEKTDDKTRNTWIHQEAIPDIIDLVSGRMLYAYFRLFNDLDSNPTGLEQFRKLVLHLMESGKDTATALPGAFYAISSMLLEQNHLYALLRALSSPIDPDRIWTTQGFAELSFVITLLTCVDAFNECDPTHAFNNVFYNLFETQTRQRMNVARLLDVAEALFRKIPGDAKQRTLEDEKILLDFVYDLFTDDDRGVERIYGVIDFTIWGNDRRPADWKQEDASWQIKFE